MRFLVFSGTQYYPGGGWEDFLGEAPDVESAKSMAESSMHYEAVGGSEYQWAHVVDSENRMIVWRSEANP